MGASIELPLARDFRAGRQARDALERAFGRKLEEQELETVKLLTTELVNNAVIHGRGEISLTADLDPHRLRIDVVDEGTGFQHRVEKVGIGAIGGRGLRIVDAEASRWGVHEGTTHVWFELERSAARLGVD